MDKKKYFLALVPMLLSSCTFFGEFSGSAKVRTVSFANINMESIVLSPYEKLEYPEDPALDDSMIAGWYLDESLTQEIVFPMEVNDDITIYPNIVSYKEGVLRAVENITRDKNITTDSNSESSPRSSYAYTTYVFCVDDEIEYSGEQNGYTYYEETSKGRVLYQNLTNTGTIFYEGNQCSILQDNFFYRFRADSQVESIETLTEGYELKFDMYTFALSLFTFQDDNVYSVEKGKEEHQYKVESNILTSGDITELICEYIQKPWCQARVRQAGEKDLWKAMYTVTISKNEVTNFKAQIVPIVDDYDFVFSYEINFTQTIDNTYKTDLLAKYKIKPYDYNEFNDSYNKIFSSINNLVNADKQSYDFDIEYKNIFYEDKYVWGGHIEGSTVCINHNDYENRQYIFRYKVDENLGIKRYSEYDFSDNEYITATTTKGYKEYASRQGDTYTQYVQDAFKNFYIDSVIVKDLLYFDYSNIIRYDLNSYEVYVASAQSIYSDPLSPFNISMNPFNLFDGIEIYPFGYIQEDLQIYGANNAKFIFKNGNLYQIKMDFYGRYLNYYPGFHYYSELDEMDLRLTFTITLNNKADSFVAPNSISDVVFS